MEKLNRDEMKGHVRGMGLMKNIHTVLVEKVKGRQHWRIWEEMEG
jgi:hypothetical protein